MIIRFSLFLVLLASFYYYCEDGSPSGPTTSPNDMNMIEIPKDFEPEYIHDFFFEASLASDTAYLPGFHNRQYQELQFDLGSSLR